MLAPLLVKRFLVSTVGRDRVRLVRCLTHARQAAGTVDGGTRESIFRPAEAGIIDEWGSVPVVTSWPRTPYRSTGDPFDDGEIS